MHPWMNQLQLSFRTSQGIDGPHHARLGLQASPGHPHPPRFRPASPFCAGMSPRKRKGGKGEKGAGLENGEEGGRGRKQDAHGGPAAKGAHGTLENPNWCLPGDWQHGATGNVPRGVGMQGCCIGATSTPPLSPSRRLPAMPAEARSANSTGRGGEGGSWAEGGWRLAGAGRPGEGVGSRERSGQMKTQDRSKAWKEGRGEGRGV